MSVKPILENADAVTILAAARAEAKKQGWAVTVAVLDDGGNLLALDRMDGAPVNSPDIAIEKGRTAALFRLSTKFVQDLKTKRPEMFPIAAAFGVEGGLPIMSGTDCVGGVGVSGAEFHKNEQVALAGLAALKS